MQASRSDDARGCGPRTDHSLRQSVGPSASICVTTKYIGSARRYVGRGILDPPGRGRRRPASGHRHGGRRPPATIPRCPPPPTAPLPSRAIRPDRARSPAPSPGVSSPSATSSPRPARCRRARKASSPWWIASGRSSSTRSRSPAATTTSSSSPGRGLPARRGPTACCTTDASCSRPTTRASASSRRASCPGTASPGTGPAAPTTAPSLPRARADHVAELLARIRRDGAHLHRGPRAAARRSTGTGGPRSSRARPRGARRGRDPGHRPARREPALLRPRGAPLSRRRSSRSASPSASRLLHRLLSRYRAHGLLGATGQAEIFLGFAPGRARSDGLPGAHAARAPRRARRAAASSSRSTVEGVRGIRHVVTDELAAPRPGGARGRRGP